MGPKPKDAVVLLEDLPVRNLARGQVGTVIERLGREIFEVEFDDEEGMNFVTLTLRADQLLVLRHDPANGKAGPSATRSALRPG